jgi:hypothetical protein
MKKEWQTPVLEMLDVKLTMHNVAGDKFDADWSNATTIPTDSQGNHMDAKS